MSRCAKERKSEREQTWYLMTRDGRNGSGGAVHFSSRDGHRAQNSHAMNAMALHEKNRGRNAESAEQKAEANSRKLKKAGWVGNRK